MQFQHLNALIDTFRDAILLENKAGKIEECNTTACQMFGYSRPDLLGRAVANILPEWVGLEVNQTFKELHSKKEIIRSSFGKRKDDTVFPLQVRLRLLADPDNPLIIFDIQDTTEAKKDEQDRRESLIEAETLHDLSRALVSLEDLPGLLQNTADSLVQALQATQVALVTFDLARREITHSITSGIATEILEKSLFDEWMLNLGGWALEEFTPASLPSGNFIQRGPTSPIKNQLTVPLIYRERVLGLITAVRPQARPPFTKADRNLLSSIANQTALAVENARLSVIERGQRKQAETLREVARILNSSLDQQRVLELILDQLARVVEYDSASIMLVVEDHLPIVAHRKFRAPVQAKLLWNAHALPHLKEVIERRVPVIISDTETDPRWQKIEGVTHIRSWLGVPLIGKNQVIGLLNLDKSQPGYYTPQDAALAAVFASQAAIAIDNARLYSTERQRVEQLDALRATVADISAELELSRLLKAILERAVNLLDATGGDLALFDEDTQELRVVTSHNMGRDYTGTRMKIGEGAMGLAIQHLKPITVDNYGDWENASAQYLDGPWHSVLAVPFLIGKRVVGAIGVVDHRLERQFTASDQHLLRLFAQHCAIAVENAHLYEAARQAAERRAILHQVSQEIVTVSLNPEGIYQAIHHAAAQLMPAEAFAITQYIEEEQVHRAVYLIDRSGRAPVQAIPANRGLSGRILETGQSIYIEDTLDAEKRGDVVHFGDPDQVRSAIAVPMRRQGQVVGMLSAQSYRPKAYNKEDLSLLEMLASYAAIALDNARLLIHTQQLAITDPLTEIINRRHLFELGQREFNRARRFNHELSVIMIDIDHFKLVNDRYGHATGDVVLFKLAQFLKANIRDIDILGRYGGEEFTIILPETDLEAAYLTAERIRKMMLENFQIVHKDLKPITASIGVAALTAEIDSFSVLVDHSDTALYQAKNNGRNRVEVYTAPAPNYTINIASPKE